MLAMLPSREFAQTTHLVRVLETGKAQHGWHIDVLCEANGRSVFEHLTGGSGRLFIRPKLLAELQAWEVDAAKSAELDELLAQAERSTGTPVGQALLGGVSTIGQGFARPHRYIPRSRVGLRVAEDNTEPARIFRRLYHFAEYLLDETVPDLILTYEWMKPVRFAMWMAAARRGIPCVAMRRSKIASGRYYWTTHPLMLNAASIACAGEKRQVGTKASISEEAQTYIGSFSEEPKMVKYIQSKWERPGKGGWFTWHMRFFRALPGHLARAASGSNPEDRATVLGQWLHYNRRYFVLRRHRRFFRTFNDTALAGMKYIYFPMHKETDLTLALQAPQWYDQRNTVELLTSCVPAGYRLLVREHRGNFGHRSTRHYCDLARLPMTLAENFYDGAGLGIKVGNPARLGAAIVAALAEPAVQDVDAFVRNLGCAYDAELETTFPPESEQVSSAFELLQRSLGSTFACEQRTVAAN
ncbi:MAG: hypothetical protein P8Y71_01915 [Pseudolabrys sp.]